MIFAIWRVSSVWTQRMVRLALLAVFWVACDGGDDMLNDAGPEDAGMDGSVFDSGPPRDARPPDTGNEVDAGFADPNTIIEGKVSVEMTQTYVHLRGTLTSTMPPLLVMTTGPHQGGVPAFFGQLGGGIGHEYMPPFLDFLLPGRFIIFYDYVATGRSGFGTVGSATVTPDRHVLQVSELLDWVEAEMGVETDSVDILGHGYGAGIGTLFAGRNPDRVNRLVLVTPMGADIEQFADAISELQARLSSTDRQRLDQITREPECRGLGSQCTIQIWSILAPRMACEGNEATLDQVSFEYADIRAFNFLRQALQNDRYDWRDEMANVQAETTVISGDCNPTAPEAAMVYTSSISGAVHRIIPNAGHWPMVETSTTFQNHVTQALRYF